MLVYLFAILGCVFLPSNGGTLTTASPTKTEKDLRYDLFQDYDKLVRPVHDPQTSIDVQVGITPLMIREVDEKHQSVEIETFTMMKWKDEYLTWEPLSYGNITALRLASDQVWKPDIAVYTASPGTSLFPQISTQVLIYPNGVVMWVPMFTISSRCPLSKRAEKSYVECNIKFGSWTFNSNLLNPQLSTTEVDLSNFQDINPDWKLVEVKSNRVSTFYPCCPGEDYPVINFNATLKRRSSTIDKNQQWSLGY